VSRYNPDKHHRRSIRLQGHDYTQAGAYFVTIVTHNREPLFGDVVDGEMALNAYGRVAATIWQRVPRHFPHVQLDEWTVMPNHVHGIIVITDTTHRRGDAFLVRHSDDFGTAHGELSIAPQVPDGECVAPTAERAIPTGPPSGSLGAIVGNFKSVTSRRINRMRKTPGVPIWQRNYYERIIRNERELNAIRQYIYDNPAHWLNDAENPVAARQWRD
jgi:REP element-mobilizing transposase RayT